jgi:uncharacterized membrane protein
MLAHSRRREGFVMRRVWMLAAITTLAACGSPPEENASRADAEAPMPTDEAVNASNEAEPQVGAAAHPVGKAEPVGVSPCLVQGTEQLNVKSLRAVGTEPFWSAQVEGRCVTYSTPDDQQGTRVWTRYSQGPNSGGVWIGQLGGKRFEMRSRPDSGCSDGMSDKRYPIAVELVVDSQQLRGCAEQR